MGVSATERDILKIIGRLKKATRTQMSKQTGLSSSYIQYLCRYLVKGGYLETEDNRAFVLTPNGQEYLTSIGFVFGFDIDKDAIKQIASLVAKEVSREMKGKGIAAHSRVQIPEEKKVEIKTDYIPPVGDEYRHLESNIDKIGIDTHEEVSDIDKTVELFKNINSASGKRSKKRKA